MPRATNAPASRERRKRVLDQAKGYRGRRSKLFRYAKDATMKAKYWAYRDRKTRQSTFRYLCRAGSISAWTDRRKSVSKGEKAVGGKLRNGARTAGAAGIGAGGEDRRGAKEARELANIDISLPGIAAEIGSLHPLTQMLD